MIKIGINENAVLEKAVKNDKGTLETTWREKAPEGVDLTDPLAAFEGEESAGSSNGTLLRIYPFDNKPAKEGDVVDGTVMTGRITAIRDVLYQILKQYMTTDKITLNSATTFAGTGITGENYATRVLLEDVQVRIYDNMVSEFIKLITPFLNDDKQAMRLLLVRQSAAKAYADYRKNFIKDNPFIEPMSIPKEQSALKFTKWEITNNRHTDAAIEATPDAAPADLAADPFAN